MYVPFAHYQCCINEKLDSVTAKADLVIHYKIYSETRIQRLNYPKRFLPAALFTARVAGNKCKQAPWKGSEMEAKEITEEAIVI